MEKKEFSEKLLRDTFKDMLYIRARSMGRSIRTYTGAAGFDMFSECVEGKMGFYRIKLGKKVPRILRKLKGTIHKSEVGYYYKLIKK